MSKDGSLHSEFCDSLQKTKAPAFASLYVVKIKNKRQGIKSQLELIIIPGYDYLWNIAGRVVDLPRILRHELMEISEVETNLPIADGVLTSDIKCPTQVTVERTSCLVVDGQAKVVALRKPRGSGTFG